jgi:hypothetical protein
LAIACIPIMGVATSLEMAKMLGTDQGTLLTSECAVIELVAGQTGRAASDRCFLDKPLTVTCFRVKAPMRKEQRGILRVACKYTAGVFDEDSLFADSVGSLTLWQCTVQLVFHKHTLQHCRDVVEHAHRGCSVPGTATIGRLYKGR